MLRHIHNRPPVEFPHFSISLRRQHGRGRSTVGKHLDPIARDVVRRCNELATDPLRTSVRDFEVRARRARIIRMAVDNKRPRCPGLFSNKSLRRLSNSHLPRYTWSDGSNRSKQSTQRASPSDRYNRFLREDVLGACVTNELGKHRLLQFRKVLEAQVCLQ